MKPHLEYLGWGWGRASRSQCLFSHLTIGHWTHPLNQIFSRLWKCNRESLRTLFDIGLSVKMLLLSIWGFYQVTFVRMQNLEMIEGFLSLVFYVIQNFKRELFSSMRDFVRNHINFFLGKKNSSTRVCIMIWWNYFHILFGFSKN